MKFLYTTTTGITMNFFKSIVRQLLEECHTVDIATNEADYKVDPCFREWGCRIYQIKWARFPLSISNIEAIKQISTLISDNQYHIVHCHTPIAAACTRAACRKFRKSGLRVIYTAHGFHFYKGSPLKNWLVYYPVERICAHWTDILITINKEDYAIAKKKMHAGRVEYVPGVGIDIKKFAPLTGIREKIRDENKELAIENDDKILLSVGELIPRKNHESVIRALAALTDLKWKYFICGRGELGEHLQQVIEELNLSKNIKLLGYRKDIPEWCSCADLFVFPSLQEGLPVALMEAIASQTPVICSKIRGNVELVESEYQFKATDQNEIRDKIILALSLDMGSAVRNNYENLAKFDICSVNQLMEKIYFDK